MIHIRFLKSNKTVCSSPELLGTDFVAVDQKPGEAPCRKCGGMLLVFNRMQEELEKQ